MSTDLPKIEPAEGAVPRPRKRVRDIRVDAMRALGLLLIILAHVNPPALLFEIRNFDVPMMAIVSGLAYRLSPPETGWIQFLIKRFKRLVLPTWIFLTLYFLVVAALSRPAFPYTASQVKGAYFLGGGFEYVWIIRVFLFIAVTAPFWSWLDERCKNIFIYMLVVSLFLAIGDAALYANRYTVSVPYVVSLLIAHAAANLGFAALFGLGFRIPRENGKTIAVISVAFAVIYLFFLWFTSLRHHQFVSTQNYKYPPRLYYLCYGGAMSLVFWLSSSRLRTIFEKSWCKPLVSFLSENSLWIYLWHILFLYISPSFITNWAAKYSFVLFAAIAVVLVQRRIVSTIVARAGSRSADIKLIFTG